MGKVKTGVYNPLPVVPIALVGANVNGKPNYMAVGFVNGVNIKPAIVYVSLNKKHHTPKGIIENGTFSINVPSADYVVETDYCGLVSGKSVDKSNIFSTFYGELETAPMIEEFPITCECRYTGQKVEFDMDTVYFGEVIQVYVNEEILGKNRKVDILKANPICYSGIENRYRTLGEDMGPAWRIGKQYKPKLDTGEPKAAESKYQCDIVERSAQPALAIRTRVSPVALTLVIGQSMFAVAQYASEKGYTPSGPPFVVYHGFDGQEQDIEIGFPFEPGIEGRDNIKVSEIPGGKSATYHYVGSYEKLPQVRAALEQWLNTNGYAVSGAAYEIYLNDPQTTAPENLETEIMVPLLSEI
jgi:flavin reductase (DIM6/NTAB) family NADH-FMN oxidoreductase RutF/effector-binding domain-containing protein